MLPLSYSANLERNLFFQSLDFYSMPTGVASCSMGLIVVRGKEVLLGVSGATTS